ncbi:D-sedoheptulose 7-phosphate isomerase [bacterium]|nr:D-sedoheptulose 7-phosphate isomerase [bacterium]
MDYRKIGKEVQQGIEGFFEKRERTFRELVDICCDCLRAGKKIILFGNGGSAAQCQHFAAELVNKFLKKRAAIPALSLTTDASALTSIGNDSSFDQVFSRQVEALGQEGDVALGISTSGNSPNVMEGLQTARHRGLTTAALTGKGGGKMAALPDFLLDVPSEKTPRIQELHLVILHLLAQEIEEKLSKSL